MELDLELLFLEEDLLDDEDFPEELDFLSFDEEVEEDFLSFDEELDFPEEDFFEERDSELFFVVSEGTDVLISRLASMSSNSESALDCICCGCMEID